MKNLTAFIKSEIHGGLTTMERSDYATKKHFKQDLRGNAIITYAILTDEQIEEIRNRREMLLDDQLALEVKYSKMHKDLVEFVDQCM